MNKFLPHITFFSIIALVVIIGFGTKNLYIASLAGTYIALCLNPIIVIGGLIIGFSVKDQLILVTSAVILAIASTLITTIVNDSSLKPLVIFVATFSSISWVYAANIIVLSRKQI